MLSLTTRTDAPGNGVAATGRAVLDFDQPPYTGPRMYWRTSCA